MIQENEVTTLANGTIGIFIPTKKQLDALTAGTFYNRRKSKALVNRFFSLGGGN